MPFIEDIIWSKSIGVVLSWSVCILDADVTSSLKVLFFKIILAFQKKGHKIKMNLILKHYPKCWCDHKATKYYIYIFQEDFPIYIYIYIYIL